jgi:hypothetical protein
MAFQLPGGFDDGQNSIGSNVTLGGVNVTTLSPGSSPTGSFVLNANSYVLNIGFPLTAPVQPVLSGVTLNMLAQGQSPSGSFTAQGPATFALVLDLPSSTGVSPTLTSVAVNMLSAGQSATGSFTGTGPNYGLVINIPQALSPDLAGGLTVTSIAYNQSASGSVTGSFPHYGLAINVPQLAPLTLSGGVTVNMLASNASPTGSVTGSYPNFGIVLGIPAAAGGSNLTLSGTNITALDPTVFSQTSGTLSLLTTAFNTLSNDTTLSANTQIEVIESGTLALSTTFGALAAFIKSQNALSITITPFSVETQSTAFTVNGTLANYDYTPILSYIDDSGSITAFPGGSTVTNTTFSFSHPGVSATGMHTLIVLDAAGRKSTVSYTVNASVLTGATLANVPGTDVAGTAITGVTATLTPSGAAAYAVLNNGADVGSRTLFMGTSVPSLTPASAGSYTIMLYAAPTGGSPVVTSSTITVTTVVATAATIANAPSSAVGGVAITGVTDTLTPSNATAYAVLNNGSADVGTRQAFTGTSVPSLTVPIGAVGTYTIKIYAALTGGVALATSTSFTDTDMATGATLANVPSTGYKSTAITGVTTTLTPSDASAYAVLMLSGTQEGSRVSFTGTSVPSLTPQASGSYVIAIYAASTGGTALVNSSAITVTVLATAATISGAPSTATAGTAITGVTDTLTPSGATGYAVLNNGSADVGSRIAFTGTNVPSLTPSAAGTDTIMIYATLTGGSPLATSSAITVSANASSPPALVTGSLAPNMVLDASKSNVLFQDTGFATPATTNGAVIGGWKDSGPNGYNFTGASGNGFTLQTGAKNGLNGVVSAGAATYIDFSGPTTLGNIIRDIVQGSTGSVTIAAATVGNNTAHNLPIFSDGSINGIGCNSGAYVQTNYNNGTNNPHVFVSGVAGYQRDIFIWNAATGIMSVSQNGGTLNTLAFTPTTDTVTWTPTLGNSTGNNYNLVYLEIDMWLGAANSTDITNINNYFVTKWGS